MNAVLNEKKIENIFTDMLSALSNKEKTVIEKRI
jgi:hypothetical protein